MIKKYTGVEQFDFQIFRFTGELSKRYSEVDLDLQEIGDKIKDFETWYDWWSMKAHQYELQEQNELAMVYYRAALFYLPFSDGRKLEMYKKFRKQFDLVYKSVNMNFYSVPYKHGHLPALFIPKEGAKKTVVVVGGFDSFMEELTSWFLPLHNHLDINLLIFDGPGQGSVPFQNLYFQYDYENVTSTLCDYFQLDEIDVIGVSWGGYFALRSAAFESRVKSVICFDIFYDAMDALKLQTNPVEFTLLKTALNLKQKYLVNQVISLKAKQDFALQWMLMNGLGITGTQSPYDFILSARKHTIQSVLPLVRQDCLLLAGNQDMYVPYQRLFDMEKGLVHASSVKTKLFTEETGGVLHCQIDKIEVAINKIVSFLRN